MKDQSSLGNQLIREIHKTIEENLSDENFSVEDLAQNLGMSRSTLHRKLIKLCGKSANELIKDIRLSRAKKLLENDTATVSEIAYQVGFNTPSYFNKVFKSKYGVSPGEVKKGVKIKEADDTNNSNLKSLVQQLSHKRYQRLSFLVILLIILSMGLLYQFDIFHEKENSIAVLPLNNLTGDKDNDYFVEGLHDALIGELGQITSLRVISRTSTLRYKNSNNLLSNIANELGVNCIVEGSVLRADDSIRILIQLIDVFPEERHLLAKEYTDAVNNSLAVQSSVVQEIAKKINIEFSKEEELRFKDVRTVNPETYRAYLRGMYNIKQGTKESFIKGIDYLHSAIASDPGDPFAYAGLAVGYAFVGHGQLNSKEAFQQAMLSANKAIKLDPNIDEAHCALAILNLYQTWDWAKAKKAFENTIRNNPNSAVAHAHFAWYHILFDDMENCIYHAKQATILEPFSAAYASWLGLLYYHNKQYNEAEKWARKALTLKEDVPYGNTTLGWVYLERKEYEKAIHHLEKLPSNGCYWNTLLGYGYVKAGQREKAMVIWEKLNKDLKNQNPYHMGIMASYLGYTDKAFELLNLAYQRKTYPITYIKFYPCGEFIREDYRYIDLLKKLNLPYKQKLYSTNK